RRRRVCRHDAAPAPAARRHRGRRRDGGRARQPGAGDRHRRDGRALGRAGRHRMAAHRVGQARLRGRARAVRGPRGAHEAPVMTVSVVVPTKDRAALLAETVRALLAQTMVADELIVVDQSATEDGRRAVIALVEAAPAGARPALTYVWDRAINGAAAARNAGLDRARGDIVVFCDDDVVPAPVVIERLLA